MNTAIRNGERRRRSPQSGTVRALSTFAAHLTVVKRGVDAELARLLADKSAHARAIGTPAALATSAVFGLAMRGGKRQRPALLAAAYEACGGAGGPGAVVMAGVALELLQTYFLIHDDWMDDSDTRRGGPSVHVLLAPAFGSAHGGDTAAILAGDQACALAQEALLDLPLPPECIVAAIRELSRIQQDVIAGQLLDVLGAASDRAAMERMHELKTGSYTVRGPLELGALLAGASPSEHALLERFARPIGVAFQLRDDLLGAFGDPRVTGKPTGTDLAAGKRTALAIELAADPGDLAGARQRVEARIAGLVESAVTELDASSLTPRGKALLASAAHALAYRKR